MSKQFFKFILGAAVTFLLLGMTKEKATFGETISGSIGLSGFSEGLDEYYDNPDTENTIPFLVTITNNYPDTIAIANVKEGNNLNVRQKAGTSYSKVGILAKNSAVIIKSISNGWAKVESGEVTGYVSTDYLLMDDNAIARADEVKNIYATVNTNVLNVRATPDPNGALLTQVKSGQKMAVSRVLVVNKNEKNYKLWVEVILESDTNDTEKVGYVCLNYVKLFYELQWAVKYSPYGTNVSDVRIAICDEAMKFIGTPYLWGGNDPQKGIDCSGLVNYVFKTVYKNNKSFQKSLAVANSMPRVSADMQKQYKSKGKEITATLKAGKIPSELQPGDLIFYANKTKVYHVAIYIGNGKIVHSSTNTKGIGVSAIDFILPAHVYYANIIND